MDEAKIVTAVAAAHALHQAIAERPLRQHHLKAKIEAHEEAWKCLTREEHATAHAQCFLPDDDGEDPFEGLV